MSKYIYNKNIISTITNFIKNAGLVIITMLFTVSSMIAEITKNSRSIPFNKSWSFTKDSITNAQQINFDDSNWRTVNLPHDWSIEDLPNQKPDEVVGPFTKSSLGKAASGWTVGGTGWYRKKFVTDQDMVNKLVSIHFDGVYMNSVVWLNGHYLGIHPYGYTPFYYDLTPYLKPVGQENVIAVKVQNEGENSRWYSGSGIYRNVWLTSTDRLHVPTWGVYITTPEVVQNSATVKINSTIDNKQKDKSDFNLVTTIINPMGKVVGNSQKHVELDGNKSINDEQSITVTNPVLWSLETPQLNKAVTEIKRGDVTVDRVETNFGIRSIKFDGTLGFSLNGRKIILKGGCIHHDNGPLGSAAFDRAEERKIEILKKNGYNAIRTSHNPPSQALLDACDRLGMLVMDEAFDTWVRPKNPDDYNLYFNQWGQKDLESMILRDRNHPSVIMWSIGNEIYEAPDLIGQEIGKKLSDEVHSLDPTRPVTQAIVHMPPYTVKPWKDYQPQLENLDVDGYNYFLEAKSKAFLRDSATIHRCDTEHALHPNKTYVVTESLPDYALENYVKSVQSPYMIGCFKWTAFDYIGEAGCGKSRVKVITGRSRLKGLSGLGIFFKNEWPIYNSYTGDFDLIGNKKTASYYQDVVWNESPIELLVHYPIPAGKEEFVAEWGFPETLKSWTWPGQEGKRMQVYVYTRSKTVKLELNGKVIAEKTVPTDSITATFDIDYQPGTLVAKGYDGGKLTCSNTLKTLGKPVAIRLVPDRSSINADINDLSYVNVEIVDAKGNVVPYVDNLEVTYQLSANATIAAVGNGNVADMSSFQQNHKKVYQGRGLVIVRSNGLAGKIILKTKAEGLKSGEIEVMMK